MLVEHLGSVNDDEQVEISVELNCPLFIITAWDKTALLTSEEMAKIIHLEQDKKDWLLRENGLLRDSGLNLHTSPGLQENETLITRQVFRQFLLHQIERGGSPQTIGVYELPSNADIKWKIFVYDEDRFDLFGVVKQDERNQQGPHFLLYAQEDEVPFPLVIIEAGKEPSIIHMCLTPFHMETNLKAREIYIKPMFLKRMMTMALFALAHRMDSESIINDIDEDDANETNNVPVDSTALGAMLIRMEQNRDSGNTPPSMLHPQWN